MSIAPQQQESETVSTENCCIVCPGQKMNAFVMEMPQDKNGCQLFQIVHVDSVLHYSLHLSSCCAVS